MNSTCPPFSGLNRRDFLRTAAIAIGTVAATGPFLTRAQNLNSKLNIASVGAAGKGSSDTDHCASENIVALCDTDKDHCAGQLKKYPSAKFYRDYRKMFEEMGKSIDAVTVSTPDHNHAMVAGAAMKLGKHVYCQKPLVQTVEEARLLRTLAKERKLITQMGNQGSAEDGLRRAVECIQASLIGPVREVYVWSNRPVWPQGMGRPEGSDPVPAAMDWDQWIGPAPMRPYKGNRAYHDFNWRGWLDFGTGALGDMACHTANMPFRALKLGYPTEIDATSSGINTESYPLASKIRFQFPAREGLVPLTFWWFDGGKPQANNPYRHDGSNKPPKEATADVEAMRGEVPGSGCLLIGDQGKVFSPDDYGAQFFVKLKGEKEFVSAKTHPAAQAIPQTIPCNRYQGDGDLRHHLEWIGAIKENKPELCYSNFDIAAYLTEIILLGCVGLRTGKKLEWDGPKMRATNAPEAAQYVKRQNRAGWAI
jgi:hypothetical protein